MMYFWAELNDEQVWKVNRVELEVNKHPGKRLLVKLNDSDKVDNNVMPATTEVKNN